MVVHYLPAVARPAEHNRLKKLIISYPSKPYKKWRRDQLKTAARLRAAKDEVRLVEVTAAEFLKYCKRTGLTSEVSTFVGFLWDKGKRMDERQRANVKRSRTTR